LTLVRGVAHAVGNAADANIKPRGPRDGAILRYFDSIEALASGAMKGRSAELPQLRKDHVRSWDSSEKAGRLYDPVRPIPSRGYRAGRPTWRRGSRNCHSEAHSEACEEMGASARRAFMSAAPFSIRWDRRGRPDTQKHEADETDTVDPRASPAFGRVDADLPAIALEWCRNHK